MKLFDKRASALLGRADIAVSVFIALAVYVISLLLYGPLRTLDFKVFDAELRVRPPAPADSRIVCIDIDDPSVKKLGRWPWPRTHLARMISEVSNRGAAAIVFDGLLVSPTTEEEDKALYDAICASGKVFSGAALEIVDKTPGSTPGENTSLDDLARFALASTNSIPDELYRVGRIVAPLKDVARCAAGIGHITACPDSDGVFRRIPLVLDAGTALYPSLVLSLAMNVLKAAGAEFTPGSILLRSSQRVTNDGGGPVVIPIDVHGNMTVNYAGLWENDFPHYSFVTLEKAFQQSTATEKAAVPNLEGKVCFICCAFTGGTDMGSTPLDVSTPLGSVLYNALNTILTQTHIRILPAALSEAMVILVALVLLAGTIRLRPVPFLALAGVLLCFYLGFVHVMFQYASLSVPAARPLLVMCLASAAYSFQTASTEHVRRRKLRDVLGHYMPDSVVSELLRNPALLSSHGERKEMTILCCSLADFDTLAASLDPEETVDLLQQYYEIASRVAHEHGGTVDKMFQSRLLAYFGHPIYSNDHPQNAVSAACAIVAAVHGLLERLPRQAADCELRAGIETGFATAGSFGTAPNMHYTVVGERVAVACHLEGQAEAGEVLMTDRTLARVGDRPLLVSHTKVRFKDQELDVGVLRPSISPEGIKDIVPAAPPSAFERKGPYRIVAKIGEGGMAVVYKGFDARLDRFVALKEPLAACLNDREYVARFLREARIMAQINHPHIVQIYTVGEEAGIPYIAMEFVDGMTLEYAIRRKGALEPGRALHVVIEVAEGLAAAYAQGVIHRDVKPSNILLTKNEDAKVSDFGLAKARESAVHLSQTGRVAGTPLFMSPEQATGKPADLRSDIYSLGVTFYFALTGEPPFIGNTPEEVMEKHLNAALQEFRLDQTGIPEGLYGIIRKMMAKDPQERFATYDELLLALRKECAEILNSSDSRVSRAGIRTNTETLVRDARDKRTRS